MGNLMGKTIMREILKVETTYNPGAHKHWAVGGRHHFTLKGCHHILYRKISEGIPANGRARCKRCEALRAGATECTTRGNVTTRYVWDFETQQPMREISTSSR